jgi:hypothetical protein
MSFSRIREQQAKYPDFCTGQQLSIQARRTDAVSLSQMAEFEDLKKSFKQFLSGIAVTQDQFLEDQLDFDELDEIEINDAIDRIDRDTKDIRSEDAEVDAAIEDLKARQHTIAERREKRLRAFRKHTKAMFHEIYREAIAWQDPDPQHREYRKMQLRNVESEKQDQTSQEKEAQQQMREKQRKKEPRSLRRELQVQTLKDLKPVAQKHVEKKVSMTKLYILREAIRAGARATVMSPSNLPKNSGGSTSPSQSQHEMQEEQISLQQELSKQPEEEQTRRQDQVRRSPTPLLPLSSSSTTTVFSPMNWDTTPSSRRTSHIGSFSPKTMRVDDMRRGSISNKSV